MSDRASSSIELQSSGPALAIRRALEQSEGTRPMAPHRSTPTQNASPRAGRWVPARVVHSTVRCAGRGPAGAGAPETSGAEGDRTPDLRIANAALSQLSYGPRMRAGKLPRGPNLSITETLNPTIFRSLPRASLAQRGTREELTRPGRWLSCPSAPVALRAVASWSGEAAARRAAAAIWSEDFLAEPGRSDRSRRQKANGQDHWN
jgi:hypothetical protein